MVKIVSIIKKFNAFIKLKTFLQKKLGLPILMEGIATKDGAVWVYRISNDVFVVRNNHSEVNVWSEVDVNQSYELYSPSKNQSTEQLIKQTIKKLRQS